MPSYGAATVRIRGSWRGRERRKLAAYVEARAQRYAREFAQQVEAKAKELAPVRTGHLKKSITSSKMRDGKWKVRVGAFYGLYVERGTRNMAAQPFLKPAIEWVKANPPRMDGNG